MPYDTESMDFLCTQDVSGKDKARPLWNRYFSDTIALIWVVDGSDHRRLQLCKQELHRVIREPELSKALVLVYVNKQDLRDGNGSTITNFHLYPRITQLSSCYFPV